MSVELQRLIAEEAARQTDIVIGFAVLCLVAIAGAAWFACIIYASRSDKRMKRMIKSIETKAKEDAQTEIRQRGAVSFVERTKLKDELKRKDSEIAELRARLNSLGQEYEALRTLAEVSPAVQIRVKKGAF